jgi:hypothetical protein
MGTEVTAEEGGGITGLGVVLFGGYLFGVPERGDGGDMLEDILGSFGELDFWESGKGGNLLALSRGLCCCDASPELSDLGEKVR